MYGLQCLALPVELYRDLQSFKIKHIAGPRLDKGKLHRGFLIPSSRLRFQPIQTHFECKVHFLKLVRLKQADSAGGLFNVSGMRDRGQMRVNYIGFFYPHPCGSSHSLYKPIWRHLCHAGRVPLQHNHSTVHKNSNQVLHQLD